MAETVVNFVFGKLADPALKEFLFLRGVDEQVEKVKRELSRIQAFLKGADGKQIRDEGQKNWVKEVRDVAYWIEDVMDGALLLDERNETVTPQPQEKKNSCFPCKTNTIKRIFRKTRKLPAIHNLGVEIDKILARIKEINESKITYGISNLGEGSSGPLRLPKRPPVLPDIDDPDVVGFDADADHIVAQLLDESTKRRSVVSIVGMGGLGKTTLARKVYNRINVKRRFDACIWVTISQEFKLIEILTKMVDKFGSLDSSENGKDEEYFINKLYQCCKGKRYLIVLDDVWRNDFLWTQLGEGKAFPDENNGSRLLITTRFSDVAEKADPVSEPYQLKFLTAEASVELLLKKALPSQDFSKGYSEEHVDMAKRFVKKCGGLPLALIVLGGLLSKNTGFAAWDRMIQTINWGVDGKACTEILNSSYDDLPLVLKPCFMYFALFSEDYKIDAKKLVRMWIAEGLIPEEENRTLEDTAESFLEEFLQRCLIQVQSRRLYDGSIEYFRIHDLLRDLAIQKAKEDNFFAVYSNENDLTRCRGARRVAVHNSDCSEFMKNASPNLRSLVWFVRRYTPDCSKQRLLKVLRTEEIEYNYLEGLTQLRYFRCRGDLREDQNFERFISSMKFLQTFDLQSTRHGDLPDCIWQVKTLRHVLLFESVLSSGPTSGADLRNLQTLTGVRSRKSWETGAGIPNLPNLRQLDIAIVEGLSWDVVTNLLGTLKHLIHLALRSDDATFKIPNMSGFPFYPHLQFLEMECIADYGEISLDTNTKPVFDIETPLDTIMLPIHLIEVKLFRFQLDQDLMPILENLQILKRLELGNLKYRKKQMRVSAKAFVQLEDLILFDIENLEELEIGEGAMPMLKKLQIEFCPQLRVPLGLQYLTSLKKLMWIFLGEDSQTAIHKETQIRNICSHVPILNLYV